MWWIRHRGEGYYADVVRVLCCFMWWIRHARAEYYACVVEYYPCYYLMGRRYLEGRSMSSESQGTKLGQRLCELHSYKNGYRPISPPGRIVSVSYRLSRCWRQNVDYMTAFKVRGNLCCKPVAPFKTYPFVRMLIWNRDCSTNAVGNG